MKTETKKTMSTGAKIGGLAGGILFLIFGVVPAFYLASFGTVALMASLGGGPVEATLIVRAVTVMGTVIGLFAAGAIWVVGGSVAGGTLGAVAEALTPRAKQVEAGLKS
jgi:hypothetical protein